MINTLLIDILRTFSAEEMKKFGEMISSPYFNKQTPLIKLFDQIKIYYPEFRNEGLRKEIVYSGILPHKKYNYGSMKNLIFDLQKLAEKFITDQEIQKNKFELKKSLINTLQSRKLNNLCEKNLKELEKDIMGKEIIEKDYFLKLHFINELKINNTFESSKGNINVSDKVRSEYLDLCFNSIKHLKKYYILDALRFYNYVITNKIIPDTDKGIKDCETFISIYKDEDFEDTSLNLELNFLKMNLGKITEDEFLKFKKLVLTDLYELKADKSIIFAYSVYLISYCRLKYKTDKIYLTYGLEIYKSMVMHENFNDSSGYMSMIMARNIILIATELMEFEWCESFLNSHLNRIHPDYRESIVLFYNAFKNFRTGDFNNSLVFLSKMKSDDIFNKNYIKELTIINYFELKYFDLLNEQLETYKKFLVNNESIPDSYKTEFYKFAAYMNKLFKSVSGKKADLSFLKKQILKEKELLFKEWFISKLEETKKQ